MKALLHKNPSHPELTELKSLLTRKNINYDTLAKHINISTQLLLDKINGYDSFDAEELDKVAECLDINPADVGHYFFPVRFG